ncbi:MAG TPA: PhnD/SsuA/transferrin family substrate-binding protein, partial [Nitrospirota bacterium]|nr:PhnD/SsuA/transferrin family substrate-binding protein [Nitrospirota bacterium]
KYGVEALVKSVGKGQPFTRSVIVTKDDSPITTLAELRGRSFAFGSERSTSSHLMPRAMLDELGIKLHDLREYRYLGRHDSVAKAVLSGEFDAGGIMETVARQYMSQGLRVLQFSETMANFNFSVGKKIDRAAKDSIKQCLLELSRDDPRHAPVLKAIDPECEGFIEVKDSEYDSIRRMIRQLYGIDYK